jgi:hypothetical protein
MDGSRKLVEMALRGERPPRTPIFDLLLNGALIERFSGTPLDGTDDETAVLAAHANALDAAPRLEFPKEEGATHTDSWGNVWRSDRWTSWIVEPAVRGTERWVEFLERRVEEIEREAARPVSDAEREAESARQKRVNAKLGGTVLAHCAPSTSVNAAMFEFHCGLDDFTFLWFDHRELVLRWMRAVEKRELRAVEIAAHPENSPFAMIYSDIAFNERLVFSKEMFLELGFFENLERLGAACHDKGMAAVFHSDGCVDEVMPDLAATGIDAFHPVEKAAGMDIFALRRQYPELTLVGGVDVTFLLRNATPEEIARETRRIISETGSEGRLLIGSTTEVDEGVPVENYLAFRDEAMKG